MTHSDRSNTIKSTDPVTVLLVYRHDQHDDTHVISVGGVFAQPESADEQVAKLREKYPDATINAVSAFLDAAAILYPGFRVA